MLLFKFFKKPIILFYIALSPVIILFAMGSDWGRWVNISYVILALIYFRLLSKNYFILDFEKLKLKFPTCAVAILLANTKNWSSIDKKGFELKKFITPKSFSD